MSYILFLCMILNTQYSFYKATPLMGISVRDAYMGEVPFIVSLSIKSPQGLKHLEKNHFCGGCLITHKHVLTAAHCVKNKTLDKVVVKVGELDLRRAKSHKIKWWITYSQWANITFPPERDYDYINDIAIVKLYNSASLDIELPIPTHGGVEQFYGQSVRTGGWGATEDVLKPRYLRIAKFSVLRPQDCRFLTSPYAKLRDLVPEAILCTEGHPPASVTCGDSGSPLLTEYDQLIGVNRGFCLTRNLTDIWNLHTFTNTYSHFIETMKKK